MLGSAASVANPNIVLNTAVAEALSQFAEVMEQAAPGNMECTVHHLLKDTVHQHKRVIFNGNGYTEEWVKEAERRGLYNLKSTPDAIPCMLSEKNIRLFTEHKIFTEGELHSRYEIWLENYAKTVNIESNTLAEMVQKDLLPAVFAYVEKLAKTASLKKSVAPDVSGLSETALMKQLSNLADDMMEGIAALKADTKEALHIPELLESARAYQTQVLEDMAGLRESADAAEALLPESLLPYPTYDKLLFDV